MNKDYLVELTKNLYRLTLLFPKKEPLRYKMREVADDILVDFIKLSNPNFSSKLGEDGPPPNLEVLDSFFEVAKSQNWVRVEDILAIQKEYDNLKGEFEKQKTGEEKTELKTEDFRPPVISADETPQPNYFSRPNSERWERILEFLRENGRAQVWQVKQVLPEVSKRTLRRDFEQMLNQRLVERIGERNGTFYQLKVDRG